MKISQTPLAASLFAAASLVTFGSTSRAATAVTTFVEGSTDAGQTLTTADSTATTASPAGSSLTMITGTFANASDADLYAIRITTPGSFSASTVNSASAAQDTALFLFNSSGVAIATNDDASGTSLDSSLPSGNSLYANLTAGTYYIGISESGNEAINLNSQLLFNGYPGGDTTAVRGAASGLNPTTLRTFNSNEFDTTTFGAYEIDLTSAATAVNPNAVPEPSTWVALGLGSFAAGVTILRRRSSRA